MELAADVTLQAVDFPATEPVPLLRNLTVRSAPNMVRQLAKLDFNLVPQKMMLIPDTVLRFEDVVLIRFTAGFVRTAPAMEFFARSPPPAPGHTRPIIHIENTVGIYSLCFGPALLAMANNALHRPPEFLPGEQHSGPDPQPANCTNSTAAPTLERCWATRSINYDLALEAQHIDAVGNPLLAGYVIHIINTVSVCAHVVSEACMAKGYSPVACWMMAAAELENEAPPPAQPSLAPLGGADALSTAGDGAGGLSGTSGGSGGDSDVPLQVVLPAVLGGVTALAAFAALAVLAHRRHARRHGSLSPPAAAACPAKPFEAGVTLDLEAAHLPPGPAAGHGSQPASKCTSKALPSGTSATDDYAAADAVRTPSNAALGCSLPLAYRITAGGEFSVARPSTHTHTHTHTHTQLHTSSGTTSAWSRIVALITERTPLSPHVRLDLRYGVDVVVDATALRGAGSFGRVLEGRFQGCPVAVKLIHSTVQRSKPALGMAVLRQEVEVLSRCSHPNIVSVLGACLTPPHLCLVMELMDQSLEQLMEGHTKQLPMEQVLQIAQDIAAGMAYLHPTVVHRDLKPANVLLGECGIAKLSDFGLSRLRDTVCETRNPETGTAPYQAPECFDLLNMRSALISHKADIYSWAVVVWEMLTGEAPWKGQPPLAVAFTVTLQQRHLPLLGLSAQRCPFKLRVLLQECWDPDPMRRPSAEEVVKRVVMLQQDMAREQAQLRARAHAAAPDTAGATCCTRNGPQPAPQPSRSPCRGAEPESATPTPTSGTAPDTDVSHGTAMGCCWADRGAAKAERAACGSGGSPAAAAGGGAGGSPAGGAGGVHAAPPNGPAAPTAQQHPPHRLLPLPPLQQPCRPLPPPQQPQQPSPPRADGAAGAADNRGGCPASVVTAGAREGIASSAGAQPRPQASGGAEVDAEEEEEEEGFRTPTGSEVERSVIG